MMNNHTMASSLLAFFLACCFCAEVSLADGDTTITLPSTYRDDLYHCANPTDDKYVIPCDPNTFRWRLNELYPSNQPDDSLLCQEVVKILVRAQEQEQLDAGQLQVQDQTQKDVQLWETIMETSVVDRLEPCVLWALSYGPLMPWASSMGYGENGHKFVGSGQNTHVDINDNSDPISSLLEVEFDPIVIALAWDMDLPEPLTLDWIELNDVTGRHLSDTLKAELGADKVEHLDLTVMAGLPDYQSKILPLTLSGKVVFSDHREVLGPSNLSRVLLQTNFVNADARDLYLFRLKIAQDSTLQEVSFVVAGREAVAEHILKSLSHVGSGGSNSNANSQQSMDTSDNPPQDDGEIVSIMLVAILSVVGASILAVIGFICFLICRSKTSGKASKTLEEYSSSVEEQISFVKEAPKKNKKERKRYQKMSDYDDYEDDGVPAVQTAPTEEANEEDEDYDIEYVAGSHVDDGVSDYDMDTLPPPSVRPQSDDDQSVVMSVMEGFDDEIVGGYVDDEEETAGNHQSDESDDNTSLYSYIPDDTSLIMDLEKKTSLQKVQNKGVLWSVMKEPPSDTDSDIYDGSELSTEQSYNKTKFRNSMLGPSSDSDSQSCDSNSLLYGTDDEDIMTGPLMRSKLTEMELPLTYNNEEEPKPDQEEPPIEDEEAVEVENESAPEQEIGDNKAKFEDLWKDENEFDEAASVLNYLDEIQTARKEAGNTQEIEIGTSSTTNFKIVDVATPVHTPERPPRVENEIDEAASVLNYLDEIQTARKEAANTQETEIDTSSTTSLKIVDVVTPVHTPERPPRVEVESECLSETEPEQQLSESLVDKVPETTEDDQMNVPLPTTLDTNSHENSSVSSSLSGSSCTKSQRAVVESVRQKKSNNWNPTSPFPSSDSSVGSTDSSKLRSLLGQGDTNDSALFFGKQVLSQKDDNSTTSSNTTPDVDLSMSSCTSNKLKSLLTSTDGRDATSDDESEDFLFHNNNNNETIEPRRMREEEKKDIDDFDDDEDDRQNLYLPASITPRGPKPSGPVDTPDDRSVYSAMSDAPSVDESIRSDMGWF